MKLPHQIHQTKFKYGTEIYYALVGPYHQNFAITKTGLNMIITFTWVPPQLLQQGTS